MKRNECDEMLYKYLESELGKDIEVLKVEVVTVKGEDVIEVTYKQSGKISKFYFTLTLEKEV